MKKTKLIKINKKYKKTIAINEKVEEQILKYLNKTYSAYTVEVEQNNGDIAVFDDLHNALMMADSNQEYLKSITIAAQKTSQNFELRFVNPDERRGATVLLEGTSYESLDIENMDAFFYQLKEIIKVKQFSYRSIFYSLLAISANIYLILDDNLQESIPYASFLITIGIMLFTYLMDLLITAVSYKENKILICLDEETIKYYNEEKKIKRRTHSIISNTLFALALAAMYLIWRIKT